jgi:hypothetical protein
VKGHWFIFKQTILSDKVFIKFTFSMQSWQFQPLLCLNRARGSVRCYLKWLATTMLQAVIQ